MPAGQLQSLSSAPSNPAQFAKRYGTMAAKIGSMHQHRLSEPIKLPSGRTLSAGQKIHLDVQDITRHPEAEGRMHWVCRHPECAGKTYPNKRALLAAHADNRALTKNEEIHLYLAVANIPGAEGSPEQISKDGRVIREAVEERKPTLLLLSDEE